MKVSELNLRKGAIGGNGVRTGKLLLAPGAVERCTKLKTTAHPTPEPDAPASSNLQPVWQSFFSSIDQNPHAPVQKKTSHDADTLQAL
jgi:hypothetical protein